MQLQGLLEFVSKPPSLQGLPGLECLCPCISASMPNSGLSSHSGWLPWTLKSYVVSLCSLEAHSEGAGLAAIACPVLLEGCSVKLSIQEGWPYLSPPPVPRLTCIAPMFSISCSALEAPRSTELTPSFLRHQAVGSKTRGEGGTLCRACLATPGHRHSSSHLGSRDA